jgi:HK97 gp10 family phage protein
MRMHITVQGLEEAKRKLGALGYLVDNVVDEAIESSAEPMRRAVQDRAPVGATGKLAAGIKLVRHSKHEWRIGPDQYYGLFQEMGTKHHRDQPFLRPGYEQERVPTRERFVDFLRRIIQGVTA